MGVHNVYIRDLLLGAMVGLFIAAFLVWATASQSLNVPAVLTNLPVGHGSTFSKPMGGAVAHVAVDWLEWQLKGDKTAARTFMGANCRLCSGTDWSIDHKGF